MKIRKARKKDVFEISMLISKTFEKFCSDDGTKEGVKRYIDLHNPKKNLENIQKSYYKSPIFFIAVQNNKIMGVIRGNSSKIGNLFVKEEYHKKGIAKKLISRFEKEAKKNNSKEIKICASLYAIPFYQKMGYKKTTGIKNFHGLKIFLMKKKFNI